VESRLHPPERGGVWDPLRERAWQRARRPHGRGARDAFLSATLAPSALQVERLLAAEPELASILTEAGFDSVAALGSFDAAPRQWTRGGTLLSSLELELSAVHFASAQRQALVLLFQPRLRRQGFVALHVELTKEAEVLFAESVGDAREARRLLDPLALSTGPLGAVLATLPPPRRRPFPRPEVAVLTLTLETRGPGGGLDLRFLVATAPAEAAAP
jgi:hypothetical protein